jgi:hypothetical protein
MVLNFQLFKDTIINVEFFQNFLETIQLCLGIIRVLSKFHNLNKPRLEQYS